MIKLEKAQDLSRLRRLAIAAQGLLQVQPFGKGLAGAREAIKHLGYVQIDTISVVERAHHHVVYSRVPKFQPNMLDTMLLNGDIFEYWSHAAAFLPIDDFRFSLPYKQAIKSGKTHWYKTPDRALMNKILAKIAADGPLRSRDLESNKAKTSGWWDWKPTKKALEQLYMQGDLMVSRREGFQKTYDLAERVLPSSVNTKMPSIEEFAEHIIERQLRCHGLVSLKGFTYLRRDAELRKRVKAQVDEMLAQKTLEQVQLPNGEVFVMEAGVFEEKLPRLKNRMLILSPFDNSVIQRDRLRSIFGFDYQIECYVPEKKRQYGYFCLPLVYRDEFVGRMDCKAHRKTKTLEIKSLHFESHAFHEADLISAFARAVEDFCRFQACTAVSLSSANPRGILKRLRDELKDIAM